MQSGNNHSPDSLASLAARASARLGIATPAGPAPVEIPIVPRRRFQAGGAQATADRMVRVIPAKFRECADLAVAAPRMSFPPADVLDAAAGIFEGRLATGTFYGPGCAGKTTGAALLVGELARLVATRFSSHDLDPAGRSLAWWTYGLAWCSAHELAAEADYADPRDGEPELMHRMRTVAIAVLDDLGNEKGLRAGSNNVPPGVLQVRYDDARITFTTTGLSSKDLEGRYGSGLMRRLTDAKDPRHVLVGAKRGGQ